MNAFRAGRGRRLLPFWLAWATACGGEADQSLERAREHGLRAGFSIEPPYAFVDPAGDVKGEAPAMLELVARPLEIEEVDWVPLEFPALIPALLAGRIDVIATGMFATPERAERVRFSRPTACAAPVLVTRSGWPGALPGSRIAVLHGSVEQSALAGSDGAEMVLLDVPDLGTAVAAVQAGSADAIAISAPTARVLLREEPGLRILGDGLPAEAKARASGCSAFGFRPEDAALATRFDAVLRDLIGSPAHLRVVEPLGFTPAEIPCPADAPPDPDGGGCTGGVPEATGS